MGLVPYGVGVLEKPTRMKLALWLARKTEVVGGSQGYASTEVLKSGMPPM